VRWFADECVDAAVVTHLRTMGHDVLYVAEIAPGLTDRDALSQAMKDGRLLLTEDKDFGELVFRTQRPVPGLVLLRIAPERRAAKAERLQAAIEKFGEQLFGRHTVVEDTRLRSRPLALGDLNGT
jgi:predicted nuclease of predicted toxin-antitoxin system